jgi:hypothetical protein
VVRKGEKEMRKINLADVDDMWEETLLQDGIRLLIAQIRPTEELEDNLRFKVIVGNKEAHSYDIRQAIGLYNGTLAGIWREK